MTKADLVEEVTKLGDLTRRDSETIVETIFVALNICALSPRHSNNDRQPKITKH